MLSRPKNGWSTLKIGNFSSRVSYLTDVPYECLNACLAALKYNIPLAMSFDAEGWEFEVLSNNINTYIIMNDENGEDILKKEDVSKMELIKSIVDNIELNISDWAFWDLDEYSVEKNKEELLRLIKDVRELM